MKIPNTFYNEPLDDEKTCFLVGLRDSGLLVKLYKAGVITPTVFKSIEVRLKIKDLMSQGFTKGQSVRFVAITLNMNHRSLYTYLR